MQLNDQQRLADFLNRKVLWQRAPLWYGNAPVMRPRFAAGPRPTAEELAAELLEDAEFQSFRLGTWLSTPDGEVLAQVVEMAMPPFYRQDAELLVEALKLAAKLQQRNQRLAGGIVLGAVVFVGFGVARGGGAAAAA